MSERRPARAPRLDAANLAGITTLMNPQHVRHGVNLQDIERTIMKKSDGARRPVDGGDPVKIYMSEINQLADELGISLDEEGEEKAKALTPTAAAPGGARPFVPPPPARSITDMIDTVDDLGLDDPPRRDPPPPRRDPPLPRHAHAQPAQEDDEEEIECDCDENCPDDCECVCHEADCDCDENCPDDCDCECHEEDDCDCDENCPDDCDCECHEEEEGDDDQVDRIIGSLEKDLGIEAQGQRRVLPAAAVPRVTDEQVRRRHINSVIADIHGETRTTFGVERERLQGQKASKLEQISQLRMSLTDEGHDCTEVGRPTIDSSMEEIDSVLGILHSKNNQNRCSSLAEEVILGFAEGIETVFDGTRPIPLLGWRPDYTGYHNTVNTKLHRMRFETSQVVGSIIEKYNIGPVSRILLELLPSFFLYPRQQRRQRGLPGLASDPNVSDARHAMNNIRAIDERNNLANI